jgi:hypothetical protein
MDETLLKEAQEEIMRHHWDTFCTQPLSIAEGGKGVIVPGCVHCRKLLYTNNQYLSHLAIDVLPGILEKFLDLQPDASIPQSGAREGNHPGRQRAISEGLRQVRN